MRFYLLATLLLLSSAGWSQLFQPGRLITHAGDTLNGLVAVQSDNTFAYKPRKKGPRSLYHTRELSGYQIGEEDFEEYEVEVIRKNFPEKVKSYLRVVEDGPLRLLEYRGPNIYGKEHVNYYLHNGYDAPYRVNRNPGNFKRTLKSYFAEVPALAEKIKQKEYQYGNLIEIVQEYNAWYIEREKDTPSEPADGNNEAPN
ncbi:MAG: hypothetical protein AAF998_10255 [Bacteroidota bacterium]